MHNKNILALFALTTSVLSAPVPSSKFSSLGSAFGNLNGDGNSVGNGNKGNENENGDGSGSNNGNGNVFENENAIGRGNSDIDILKRGYGSNVMGSAFGNLNSNGGGNSAGNDSSHDGNGNGVRSGSWDRNGNTFGNGNAVRSDNSGMSISKRGSGSDVLGMPEIITGVMETEMEMTAEIQMAATTFSETKMPSDTPILSSYVNGVWVAAIDPITNSLSSSGDAANAVGTVTDTLGGNSGSNTAGSSNSGNGNGNDNTSGSNNGNGNTFGNGNQILSNNGGVDARRQFDAADIIPDQTVTGLTKDVTVVFKSFHPTGIPGIVKGAATGTESDFGKGQNEKCQLVLTGLGDIIAQDVAAYIPSMRFWELDELACCMLYDMYIILSFSDEVV
ncbi:hypothetical protein BPOR_0006g00220 [Botrytis porri]|uniref:Uncharacterized protein n=1 Tax=Botrytis porri TaxID=87229 RepID=A0A4Z1L620_9HELO|nr:hypothetical protein BPOR_0006g00220 [Botrytis porri]